MKLYRFLTAFLIIILVLGQFSRFPLPGTAIFVYLNDLLLPMIIGLWIIDVIRRKNYTLPKLSFPIFLFFSIAGISLIWNKQFLGGREFLESFLYLWRLITYFALYFIMVDLISQAKDKKKEIMYFLNLLLATGVVVAVFGLVQYLLFPDFSSMVAQGWDPHYYRVLSTFFDPNYVGGFLVFNLNVIILLSLEIDSWKKLDLKKGSMAVIILMAIVLTFSRSTYLTFAVSMLVIGILKSRKLLLFGALMGVLVFLLIPRVQERIINGFVNIDESASFRFESWQNGLEVAQKNLVIGTGYNAYRSAQIRYGLIYPWEADKLDSHSAAGVDSSLILILATTGIPGLLAYLLLIGNQLILSFKTYFSKVQPIAKVLSLAVFSCLLGLLVHSQFVNSLLYPFILEWFLILFALFEGSL